MENNAMKNTVDFSTECLLHHKTKNLTNENPHPRKTRNGGHSRMDKIASTKNYLHLQKPIQNSMYRHKSGYHIH